MVYKGTICVTISWYLSRSVGEGGLTFAHDASFNGCFIIALAAPILHYVECSFKLGQVVGSNFTDIIEDLGFSITHELTSV